MANDAKKLKKTIQEYYSPVEDAEGYFQQMVNDQADRLEKTAESEREAEKPPNEGGGRGPGSTRDR
ncbi:MAG: hypothetical protein ACYSXF_11105 [Planctomycetota bacterium]|jgi:hypothetical protein